MLPFVYQAKTRIVFGSGTFSQTGKLASELGTKALVVCNDSRRSLDLAAQTVALLEADGVRGEIFSGVVPNPTTDVVNAGAEQAKRMGANVIVGLGGGSSIDAAKAIAIGATHPGEAWDYRLWQKPITDKVLPVLAVTTTAGTGAEVTPVSVVTKTSEHCKFALVSSLIIPHIAVVDPRLTLSAPANVTAATGFDAYCHAFESTIHKNANEYVTLQAHFAMKLVVDNLPVAVRDSQNLAAREALSLANTVAGLCIANVGTTLPHGIGMAIGGSAPHVSHGEALAIVYPEIARLTWKEAVPQYAAAARQIDPALESEPDETAAKAASGAYDAFLRKIRLRLGFADRNVSTDTIAVIVKDTFGLPDYSVHPVVVDEARLTELLAACANSMDA